MLAKEKKIENAGYQKLADTFKQNLANFETIELLKMLSCHPSANVLSGGFFETIISISFNELLKRSKIDQYRCDRTLLKKILQHFSSVHDTNEISDVVIQKYLETDPTTLELFNFHRDTDYEYYKLFVILAQKRHFQELSRDMLIELMTHYPSYRKEKGVYLRFANKLLRSKLSRKQWRSFFCLLLNGARKGKACSGFYLDPEEIDCGLLQKAAKKFSGQVLSRNELEPWFYKEFVYKPEKKQARHNYS